LTAGTDRDRRDVAAFVLHLEVAVPEGVTNAIHDARGPERDPQHLHAPHERADEEAEEIDVDPEHDDDAKPIQAREQMALEPIVGCTLAILLEQTRLPNGLAVVERA